jgi:thymidylate synthase (FAD)
MKIVEPYAKMMDVFDQEDGIELLRKIEWAGRISHRSEDAQTPESWKRFIETVVLGHGDWSIVEHAGVTVDAVVDRGITHEWVRHRLFSFTQESTRFVNYEKKMPASFIRPEHKVKPDPLGFTDDPNVTDAWDSAIEQCEVSYQSMLKAGCSPQIARSVLPNALASRIITTGNLRNWRHFLIMRTTKEAHPQMRQVTIPLLAEFKAKIPILFDDIEPLAKQSESMKRMR